MVGVEDGLGDGGLDGLAVFRGLGTDGLVEISLNDPTAGIVFRGFGGRERLFPEVGLPRGQDGDGGRCGLGGKLDGVRDLDSPGGALVDALGMIGNLAVDELNEPVNLLWTGDDRDVAADYGEETIELTAEKASLGGRRGDGAKDGRTVDGVS